MINWHSLVLAAVGYGVGGGVGALLSNRIRNKQFKAVAFCLPIILGGNLAPLLWSGHNVRSQSRLANAAAKYQDELMKNPKFKSSSERDPEGTAHFVQNAAHLGLKRLQYMDLEEWNRLRLKLAEVSPTVCAGYWTGRGIGQAVDEAASKLSDPDLDQLARISMRAAVLELEEQPFNKPPADAISSGITIISLKLNEQEKERLKKTLQAGAAAQDTDACWTFKTLVGGAEGFPQDLKDSFLRALASI